MLEDGKIAIFLRSIENEAERPDIKAPKTSAVRARIIRGGFVILPRSHDECMFHFMYNADAQVPVLPYWLINFFVGKVIHVMLGFIAKAAKFDDDSEYAERVRKNPEVYGYVEDILNAHFSQALDDDADVAASE
jgi:START domain